MKLNSIQVECKMCKNKFEKNKYDVIKSPNHFCSRSCAAKYNNKTPKRKAKLQFCKKCTNQIFTKKKRNICDNCLNITQINATLAEVKSKRIYQKYSRIREWARKIMLKSNQPRKCKLCPYNITVEVCHIRAISSFPESALISEINSLDNLIYLCPNCHWEFDHGLKTI